MRERKIKEPQILIKEGLEGEKICNSLNELKLNQILNENDTVTIIPNWVNTNPVESGTVVGPESLREIIKYIKSCNVESLVVASGSGGAQTPEVMKQTGYQQVIAEEGVQFIDLNFGPYDKFEIDFPAFKKLELNKLIKESDFIISYTQIKHHEEATVSLGIKNVALSTPPGEIHGFPKADNGIHEHLHDFITEMGKLVPIDLSILSGDKAMVGTGPSKGKAVDTNLVVVGTDPISTDVVGARLLGFRPQAVQYLHNLIRAEIGEGDLQKVNLKGLALKEAEQKFSKAAYGEEIVLDKKKILPLHLECQNC